MPEKDDLDLRIDAALAAYGDPGAEAELDRRILAAARGFKSKAARPWRRWLPWAIAIPVAAGLLAVWLSVRYLSHAPSTQPMLAHHAQPQVTGPRPAEPPEPVRTRHPSGAKVHSHFALASSQPSSCRFKRAGGGSCATPGDDLAKSASVPKLDVFPTPQPLTAQERTLALVSTEAQPPLREALVEAQKDDDAPVHIAAIHIPPIALPSQTDR